MRTRAIALSPTGKKAGSGSDSDRSPRGATAGGILRQLIEETDFSDDEEQK